MRMKATRSQCGARFCNPLRGRRSTSQPSRTPAEQHGADEGPRSWSHIAASLQMPLPRGSASGYRCHAVTGGRGRPSPAGTRDTIVSSHVAAVIFVSGFTHSGYQSKAIAPAPTPLPTKDARACPTVTPGHNACEPFNRVRDLLLQDLSGPAASPQGGEHHERSDGHGRQRRDTLQAGPAAACAGGIHSGVLRRRAIAPVGSARAGTLELHGGNVQAVR